MCRRGKKPSPAGQTGLTSMRTWDDFFGAASTACLASLDASSKTSAMRDWMFATASLRRFFLWR
eukprot:2344749-Alexandrium_andersonii.AAC.1